ncbi:MAG: hypothetical protein QOG31_1913 [Thermoplasmata archaeon]|nr:hypothetical protein [Thermoplasmata archaeon]
MAEERKDAKDDGYQFVPPDFDEDAFVHREMVSFKTTAILFVWGIVAAAASWAAFVAVGGSDLGWFIGLALCALFGYALKVLYPRLGADIAHFKRKEWVGTGFLFFFTWLSFFVLAVNPPVTDIAPPQVFLHAGPPIQEAGSPVTIDVFATDNQKVSSLEVRVTRDGAELTVPFDTVGPNHLRGTLPTTAAGRYTATATATDPKGHTGRQVANLTIGRVLDVTWPPGNLLNDATQVFVKVGGATACTADYDKGRNHDCIRTVELRSRDGPSVTLEPSGGGWRADGTFAGWATGNHTYQVVAEYPTQFLGSHPVPGGNVTGPSATLNVASAGGTHQVAIPPEPSARSVLVPAPSLGLVAVALLALAFLLRRRA